MVPQLDSRLEHRLIDLYQEHCIRASKIDWSYHDFVPWEQGRSFKELPWSLEQRKLPPAIYTAIETALLTEVNLPWFTTYLSTTFVGSLHVMKEFIYTWVSEEDQHSNLLENYLILTRNANPQELHNLRKIVVKEGFELSFTTPIEALIYATIQELATQVFYVNVAKMSTDYDPQLSVLLRRLAKDESLHYAFYRDAVKAHLDLEPNYLYYVANVFKNFVMPGHNMPNYEERMKAIAKDHKFGPAQFYQQVTRVLIDYWDLPNLQPTVPEAEKARLEILKYSNRLSRISARYV